VSVEWRPVRHVFAGSAVPARVPTAAVSEAGDVADEDLAGAELVTVRAASRWVRDPFAVCRLHEVADHVRKCARRSQGCALSEYPALKPGLVTCPTLKLSPSPMGSPGSMALRSLRGAVDQEEIFV
jgi:hypothetical protein